MPRNQAGRLVREAGPRSWPPAPKAGPGPPAPGPGKLAPSFIVQKAFYTFDKTQRSMGNTRLCSVRSSGSFYTSFGIQKVSGEYIIFWPRGLLTLFGSLP